MGDRGNRILGAVLIFIGILMLLGELGLREMRWVWPVAVLAVGVFVLQDYRRKRDDSGKVFTGSTLVLLAFFLLLVVVDVIPMSQHWPFFVAAPGIGLLVMAKVDARRRDAMVPGWMAIAVAAILYFFTLGLFTGLLSLLFSLLGLILKVVVPLGLIAGGAWLLFQQHQARQQRDDVPEKVEPERGWGPSASEGADESGRGDERTGDEAVEAEPYTGPGPEARRPEEPMREPHPPVEDAEVDTAEDSAEDDTTGADAPSASAPPRPRRSLMDRRRRAQRQKPLRRRPR